MLHDWMWFAVEDFGSATELRRFSSDLVLLDGAQTGPKDPLKGTRLIGCAGQGSTRFRMRCQCCTDGLYCVGFQLLPLSSGDFDLEHF